MSTVPVYVIPVSKAFYDSLPRTRLEAWLMELPIKARMLRFLATRSMSVATTGFATSLALAFFNQAIAACNGEHSITVAWLHLDASRCAQRIGDLEPTENHLRAAIEIFCDLPPTHLAVLQASQDLVDVMTRRGRRAEALQFIQHLLAETKVMVFPYPVAIELKSLAQSL
jgi:hypothetical protein